MKGILKSLWVATVTASQLIMLYIFSGIARFGELIVNEPNSLILWSEIASLSFGFMYTVKHFWVDGK